MATAVCPVCTKNVHWSATRGARLADLRCPRCGSPLQSIAAGKISPLRGKTYGRCEVCGEKHMRGKQLRQVPMGGVKQLLHGYIRLRAGGEACYFCRDSMDRFHGPLPAGGPDFSERTTLHMDGIAGSVTHEFRRVGDGIEGRWTLMCSPDAIAGGWSEWRLLTRQEISRHIGFGEFGGAAAAWLRFDALR